MDPPCVLHPKGSGGLGFRDIELFNLALLARQAWRILQDPGSLSARVLKAVYFPAGELMDAELGSSPSRVWRAIVDGIQVLQQGLIRRIGSGESTKNWESPWLPRDSMLLPLRPTKDNPPQWVSELIDQFSRRWNRQPLRKFFSLLDWETIENIPLSATPQDDFRAWHYEKKGIFSVRSAYRVLVRNREVMSAWAEDRPGRSDTRAQEEWSDIWRIKVP